MNLRPFVDDDAPAVAAFISTEEDRLYEKGCGLGTEIVERGEAFARAEGVKKLFAAAPEPDAAARALFESRGYREVRRFYEALTESFAEHWEWHPKPYEEWIAHRQGQHRDGDELAAVTRNDASVAVDGYVGAIGVRPAWRGKGLAKALLYRTFAEFWRRGTTRVTLDADSQNATGAVALYERVGMHVDTCGVAFEKANE